MKPVSFHELKLLEFLHFLRRRGFSLGIDHYLDVQRLLLLLADQDRLPATAADLKTVLAPLLCRSREEQERFADLFAEWLAGKQPGVSNFSLTTKPTKPEAKETDWLTLAKKAPFLPWLAGFLAIVLLAGGFAWWAMQPRGIISVEGVLVDSLGAPLPGKLLTLVKDTVVTGDSGQFSFRCPAKDSLAYLGLKDSDWQITDVPVRLNQAPDSLLRIVAREEREMPVVAGPDSLPVDTLITPVLNQVADGYRINPVRLLFGLLPFGLFLTWTLWRAYRRKVVLQNRGSAEEPDLTEWLLEHPPDNLLLGAALRRAGQELRRRLYRPGSDLDPEATVTATLEKGGYFTPVARQQRVTPEYLVLIDRQRYQDQPAAWINTLLSLLEKEGLAVYRYYYDRDPYFCFPADDPQDFQRLADLISRFRHCRLLLFSDGESCFDPFSGAPQDWLQEFAAWPERALFLPPAVLESSGRVELLEEQDFLLFPAGDRGLEAFAERLQGGAPLLREDDPPPAWLRRPPHWWFSPTVPEKAEITVLRRRLKDYLGIEAYTWLGACAVYPELDWNLLLYLGGRLRDSGGRPLLEGPYLEKMLRLPWFREGHLPGWLREMLIRDLPAKKESRIREALVSLLLGALGDWQEGFALQVAAERGGRRLRDVLREVLHAGARGETAQDWVFLCFISGSPLDKLLFYLPDAFRNFVQPTGGGRFFRTAVLSLLLLLLLPLLLFWPLETVYRTVEPEGGDPGFIPGMVFIPGGQFEMGDVFEDNHWDDEKPVHTVTVSDFFLDIYEVTFAQYDAFCAATGRDLPDDEGWGRERHPVINVSWYDAAAYCNWRSKQAGLDTCYQIDGENVTCNFAANGFRLPTEAEWEYAAREGGRRVRFGNGRDIADPAEINFDGSEGWSEPYYIAGKFRQRTVPVDSLLPNALGLYHMSGNVWEWCWDWYDSKYYANSPEIDPRGPESGMSRVLRGGSWPDLPRGVRAAFRGRVRPGSRDFFAGFRCARTP